jgi:CheY-like chemotaxis protein
LASARPREDATFSPDRATVIAATVTLQIPASTTIGAAASWKTELLAQSSPGNVPLTPIRDSPNAGMLCEMSRRCLIVDDNDVYLSEARKLLQRQGMSVVGVASTSSDALAIAESERPDIALVDVDLGAESGLDVAHALAACQDPVPVILISAYAENDLRELLADSPAVGFLSKSVLSRAAIDSLLVDCAEH